ncbi:hypothetical protein EVAR_923_1 [Eumeta japonica]|uniref:Uncharacterized protein n=1 Tax=Eumeta variegata TaxID=151549 RepID=A0A4C1SDV3_EUMVA|nr:hypothetical protein EVAR_923_1 [Eumeta japonica]
MVPQWSSAMPSNRDRVRSSTWANVTFNIKSQHTLRSSESILSRWFWPSLQAPSDRQFSLAWIRYVSAYFGFTGASGFYIVHNSSYPIPPWFLLFQLVLLLRSCTALADKKRQRVRICAKLSHACRWTMDLPKIIALGPELRGECGRRKS